MSGKRKLPTKCRLCGGKLQAHERPEGECDSCLRSHATAPDAVPAGKNAMTKEAS